MSTGSPEYIILDTDAFSYLLAKKPQASAYGRLLQGKIPALAFVSLAEVRYGALHAGWGERRLAELEASVRKFLVLPFHEELTTVWARLKNDARQSGHPFAHALHANDLWIAACGAYYGAPILTGNVRHFQGLGTLHVIDGS